MKKILFCLLVFITAARAVHAQIITTIAGNGVRGNTGDGGYSVDAECNPLGITTDTLGNIYIADAVNNIVRVINGYGEIRTVAGNGFSGYSGSGIPATNTDLDGPIDVAVDNKGNLYIAEMYNNLIKKVSSDGIITTIAGGGKSRSLIGVAMATDVSLSAPKGIAVDDNGNVYITEQFNHCVSKISNEGVIMTIAGTGFGGYNGDNIMATDAQLNNPFGLSIDIAGSIFVADQGNARIRKIGTSGIITTIAGDGTYGYNGDAIPATIAKLKSASDIYADKSGVLYIADIDNNRIRKIDADGIITTIAGTGAAGYSGDGGAAVVAQLNGPVAVTVNNIGFVYIADAYNYRLRYMHTSEEVPKKNKFTNSMVVFPDPCHEIFTVRITSSVIERAVIIMTNILGAEILQIASVTNKDINIQTAVPPGIYLLTAYTEDSRYSYRVSVVR